MRAVRSLLATSMLVALALMAVSVGDATATRCRRCAVGTCPTGMDDPAWIPCLPSRSGCVPNGGILGFTSLPPHVQTRWTLFAERRGRRSLGRLRGRLRSFADNVRPLPALPGFPGRCEAADENPFPVCHAESARFSGLVVGDRLVGSARYPDGSTCEFNASVIWGLGEPEPNSFLCRTPSGEVMSEGALRVQLIRLSGCQQ